jgi:type IV pilus assembly protein PilM
MLKSKSFLGVDCGAGSLKIAEFAATPQSGLRLLRFGIKSIGLAGSQDAARDAVVKKGLIDMLSEFGFLARNGNLCAPGYQVFSKFVKLPPVDSSKVTQIIQYEAQQNVPFPLAETAWDYQILGSAPGGEFEVLLVAIKSDLVEKLFGAGESAGLKMTVVDASVGALANAFRFNYADQEGCSLLLDIGAKTSNVLLFEANKYYSRSINIGANAITQEFAAEAKLRFDDAEKFKLANGFVSLGGAYEEPEDPRQAAVSKVARNVLTRLHLQVNQTIQFYRTQQGGGAPVRVYLCGGGSGMAYAAEFFQEKLNLPVEFFNPFRNVEIDPTVPVQELEKVAQCFGEVVGLGLRAVARCPVEFNLMPKASLSRQEFSAKKPYLLAASYALAAGVGAAGLLFAKVGDVYQQATAKIGEQLAPLEAKKTQLESEQAKLNKASGEANQLGEWLDNRSYWPAILTSLRRSMLTVEENMRQKHGVPVGVWVDVLLSTEPTVNVAPAEEESSPRSFFMSPEMMKRYRLGPYAMGAQGAAGGDAAAAPTAEATPATQAEKPKPSGSTNELSTLRLTIRAVNLKQKERNAEIPYQLVKELKADPLFDSNETQLNGNLETVDDTTPTFTFPISLKLKRPIKL